MELKRKVEYNLAFTFLASKCFKRYRNLTLVSDGVRYDKPSIATGMKSTLIFFQKIFHMYIFDSQSMHN